MRKLMEESVTKFDWNGQSGKTENEVTNQIEVKLEDLPSGGKNLDENVVIKPIEIQPKVEKNPVIKKNFDVSEVEKKLNFDPEEATPARKHVFEMLWNKSKSQGVIKKE